MIPEWVLAAVKAGTLDKMAMAEVDALRSVLEDLQQLYDPDNPDWQAAMHHFLWQRDALEEAYCILFQRGESRPLAVALVAFDRCAERWMDGLPVVPVVDDGQLRERAVENPELWWVQPAVA
jgi:hypothetical protein